MFTLPCPQKLQINSTQTLADNFSKLIFTIDKLVTTHLRIKKCKTSKMENIKMMVNMVAMNGIIKD